MFHELREIDYANCEYEDKNEILNVAQKVAVYYSVVVLSIVVVASSFVLEESEFSVVLEVISSVEVVTSELDEVVMSETDEVVTSVGISVVVVIGSEVVLNVD